MGKGGGEVVKERGNGDASLRKVPTPTVRGREKMQLLDGRMVYGFFSYTIVGIHVVIGAKTCLQLLIVPKKSEMSLHF